MWFAVLTSNALASWTAAQVYNPAANGEIPRGVTVAHDESDGSRYFLLDVFHVTTAQPRLKGVRWDSGGFEAAQLI
jgi:hypothetical protein